MLPNPVLRSVQEVKTQIELEELAQDVDMLFMYALMITEHLWDQIIIIRLSD